MKKRKIKMTLAKIKFWQNKTPEERSNHARMMAKKRQEKLTPEQRKLLANVMSEARAKKRKELLEFFGNDRLLIK